MKKDDLEKKKASILEEIRILDIATSKVVRDEGFIPFSMRSNKGKLMDRLKEVDVKLIRLESKSVVKSKPVKPKHKTIKKEENGE